MQYISPLFLLLVFGLWITTNVFGINFSSGETNYSNYVRDLFIQPNAVAWMSVALIGIVAALFIFIIWLNPTYREITKETHHDK